MRVLHFSRSLKIMVLENKIEIIYFYLHLHYKIYIHWHHVNVFQKYNTQMLCKCVNFKICSTKNANVIT